MEFKNNGCFKVLSALLVMLFLTVMIATNKVASAYKNTAFKVKILLDAGHGGIDGGCTGSSPESVESTLNLLITKELETVLKERGFSVFLTRENDGGLYEAIMLSIIMALLDTKIPGPRGPKPLMVHHIPNIF